MAFSRWDPLPDLLALHVRIESAAGGDAPGWTPSVDVYETSDQYVVSAELPGLADKDIEISYHEGHLTLTGERPPSAVTCEQYHRVERGHGRFSRTFVLPDAIDAGSIAADLREGVLTITVPKGGPREPLRIHVV